MKNILSIQKLLDEYSNKQIDLGVQNKIQDLLDQSKEYNKDLEAESYREDIDDKIAENFEIRGYIDQIIDYIENNEVKLAYDLVYTDLNKEVRKIIMFISDNNDKFNNGFLYLNFFANIINKLSTERLTRLGSYREKYVNELLSKGVNISKESFYLKIKNEVFDLINELNFEYIYNVQNPTNVLKGDNEEGDEIDMNNKNLELIFELIDEISENSDLKFADIKKGDFKYAFEYIKEFLLVNEDDISLLMKNSIYFLHFSKIVALIDYEGEESMGDIKEYLELELNENSFDKVSIGKGYYDEMKAELYDLVKDLNNLLLIKKTT